MLQRRLQVLIDEQRHERLRRESMRQGAPIGELVRRAIDREFPPESEALTPKEAAVRLLAAEPPTRPEPDWEAQKAQMADELGVDWRA